EFRAWRTLKFGSIKLSDRPSPMTWGRHGAFSSVIRDRRNRSRIAQGQPSLLAFHRGAGGFQFLLELRGVVLADGVLDGRRSRLHEILRFLEAEARDRADDLDDFDLLLAGGLEGDRELGLLLGRSGGTAGGGSSGDGDRSRG